MISGCRFWQSQKPRISIGQICNPAVLGPCTCTTTPAANPCPSSTRQLGGLIPGHGVYACQGARLRGYAGPRTTESDRFDMLRRSFFMRFNMRHDFLQLQISPMLRGSAGMVRITCPGPFFQFHACSGCKGSSHQLSDCTCGVYEWLSWLHSFKCSEISRVRKGPKPAAACRIFSVVLGLFNHPTKGLETLRCMVDSRHLQENFNMAPKRTVSISSIFVNLPRIRSRASFSTQNDPFGCICCSTELMVVIKWMASDPCSICLRAKCDWHHLPAWNQGTGHHLLASLSTATTCQSNKPCLRQCQQKTVICCIAWSHMPKIQGNLPLCCFLAAGHGWANQVRQICWSGTLSQCVQEVHCP